MTVRTCVGIVMRDYCGWVRGVDCMLTCGLYACSDSGNYYCGLYLDLGGNGMTNIDVNISGSL